jgi:DNA processing protein
MTPASTATAADIPLWLALSEINGLGNLGFCQLLREFGSPETIFAASHQQLQKVVSSEIARHICSGPDEAAITPALDWLQQSNNHLVTLADSAYPQSLLEIPDPPPLLYAKGNLHLLQSKCIAVVGSRNSTPQGEKNAEDFSTALSEHGYCIVSGMALGIDGAAHRGALRGTGATIAVIGTGMDIVYPSRHRELAHQIAERGLIVSEFSLGTPSKAQNFPRRNRLISGLSIGCLVVEANVQSGSLITARLAAEQGREVFAIPGSIHSPLSKGCHQLIKQGAKLVDSIKDIVDELGSTGSFLSVSESPAIEPHPILDCMGYEAVTADWLIEHTGLTSDSLSSMLLMLELENKISSLPGGRYQRIV